MNCLNTMGSGINNANALDTVDATITGTGTYTSSVNGTLYKYTFTAGSNNIRFNRNIKSMNVIVVGSGGAGSGGSSGSKGSGGAGGAGGGFGVWVFAYTSNSLYNIVIGSSSVNSSFLSDEIGVSASRGGVFTKTGSSTGTITAAQTGGAGGSVSKDGNGGNGGNSSGTITVLDNNYNYGGGGKAGGTNTNGTGGNPGANGVGGTTINGTNHGESAITPGSGGGGGCEAGNTSTNWGGSGGPGLIIITFYYP